MFSYSMVNKELEELFNKVSLARTAFYEAMLNAQKNNETMTTAKLSEGTQHVNALVSDVQDLKRKIQKMRAPETQD